MFAIDWSQVKFPIDALRPPAKKFAFRVYFAFARGGEAPGRHRRARAAVLSSRQLTGAAVFLAGRTRSSLADEWRCHLAGWTGQGLARREQTRVALGFLRAAAAYGAV